VILQSLRTRSDSSDAALGAALRAAGVQRVTARAASAWGWIERREVSVPGLVRERVLLIIANT